MDNYYIDYILIGVMAVLLIAVAIMLFLNRLWVAREKKADATTKNQINRLGLTLQTGKLQLWIYKVDKRRYSRISETGEYSSEMNPIDFAQFFDRDDFERLRTTIFDMREGQKDGDTIRMKGVPGAEGGQRHYEVMLSIVERDDDGHPATVLGVQRDITDKLKREQETSQLLMRYHTVFNSSLSDMIYYDKDGRLSDINDKACSSFSINDRGGLIMSKLRIEDNPLFNAIDFNHIGTTRTTAILHTAELADEGYDILGAVHNGKYYYEASINTIANQDGELEGVYVSGRNVTEFVESVHRQEEGVKRLRTTYGNIQKYIHNINYALRVSDVRFVHYYPDKYTFEITNNISQAQLRLSQVRCIRLASPRFRKDVSILLNKLDHKLNIPVTLTIEIILHDDKNRPIWLMFNMIPVLDANGQVDRYFGMCRNMTDMMETEHRLAIETQKAQETETLKQAFLTNMSHEIRTPLNTVIGFAELFEADHDPADEPVFVGEIKKNSNQLLNLVNDILFLSRLDAQMIESNRSETDFPLFFDSCCQTGLSNVNPAVRTIIENDYEHLIVDIDSENLSKLIQRACLVASLLTQQGSIRCKYEYWSGELIIIIEDTGMGFATEDTTYTFNHFDRNQKLGEKSSGLDLPIIQSLARLMGGDIEAQSEKGRGTTARITIPCKATVAEKKKREEK